MQKLVRMAVATFDASNYKLLIPNKEHLMPKAYRMMDRALDLFTRGRIKEAMSLITDALSIDPENLCIWDAYISILTSVKDCERARQLVLGTKSFNVPNEFGWLVQQQNLLRRIESKEQELQRLERQY